MLKSFDLFNKFQKIIQQNKLSHIYLIDGGTDEQRTNLSLKIVSEILKNDIKFDRVEKLIKIGNYPNFYYLSKNDFLIKKEDIEALKKYFSQTSLINEKRVYVIEEIGQITLQAGNSLLNFLENPLNNNMYGFLLTKDLSKILPTILSRCQVFSLGNNQNLEAKKYYFFLQKQDFEIIDCFLISLIGKQEKLFDFIESSYYKNFKSTFLNLIDFLQKKQYLRFYFIYCPLLKEKKGWFSELLFCLLRFFLSFLYYKKQITVYLDQKFFEIYFIDFSSKTCYSILNLLISLQKKEKYVFNDEDLFMSLLIGLDDKIFM